MSELSDMPPASGADELKLMVVRRDAPAALGFLANIPPSYAARCVAGLDQADQAALVTMIGSPMAADIVEEMTDGERAEFAGGLSVDRLTEVIANMVSDERADFVKYLDDGLRAEILRRLDRDAAVDVRRLIVYPDRTAGGLMQTEFIAFPASKSVDDVRRELHDNAARYSVYPAAYVYVVDDAGRLAGIVSMRDLVMNLPKTLLADIMSKRVISAPAQAQMDELTNLFTAQRLMAVPVVDEQHRLIGIVTENDVLVETRQGAAESLLRFSGIADGEESRELPTMTRAGRRLSWLSINILLNVMAASVIAVYQDTLQAVIALAVFLPIISDMSGCSGNQAIAVSIRELALGRIGVTHLFWVMRKEVGIGIVNGLGLGLMMLIVSVLWKGNMWLGLVVGGALALNTVIAVLIGGAVPLILKKLNKDPAMASGPILTTITDMSGFFLTLSLATALLSKLHN